MRVFLLTFALFALFFGSSVNGRHLSNPELHEGIYHPSSDSFLDWIGQDFYFDLNKRINAPQLGEIGRTLLKKIYSWAPSWLQSKQPIQSDAQAEEYPYFKWIPYYETSALVDGPVVHWSAPCFSDSSAKVTRNADGKSYTLTLNLNKPTGILCNDFYLLATVEGVKLQAFYFGGQQTITWEPKANARPAEIWDIENKGIRIFRFFGGELDVVSWLLSTAQLFEPLGTKAVSDAAAAANLDFLKKYANIQTMNLRNSTGVPIDASLIQSGDFLGVIRLDGLDPMLAWAMGAHTGHTTIAMWEGGVLYIMESTTNSTYWPTNGIQKTPFNIWIEQAREAGYNVVWSPLKDSVRKNFNVSAALEFFYDNEGYDYGYYNMLMAWIDTPQENYPCVAPDYKLCLRYEQVEILISILDNVAPAVSDMLFRQAFNNRLGTKGLMAAELFQLAYKQGVPYRMLPTIPEKDTFIYDIDRNWQPTTGISMVCCVFVCHMWKAGGLFDSINREINCGEMTNWDDYSLDILEYAPARKIPQCVAQDPDNDLCQLTGKYAVQLPGHGSKAFYAHMAERCPAEAPDYIRPANC